MAKLTQKDLIQRSLYEEGIGSMLKQAAKSALKTGVGAAKALGASAAPKTAAALGKLGEVVSSNFVEIMAANPKNGLRSWLNTPEGRRLFKDVSLGKEKTLANNDVNVNFKGKYIDPKTPNEPREVQGIFSVRKEDEGKWGIMGANDNEGNVIWVPTPKKDKDKNKKDEDKDKDPVTSETPERPEISPEPEEPETSPEPEKPEVKKITTSSFKNELKEFAKNKLPGENFNSISAVTEFVRSLAKDANNATYYKNIPQIMKQIKKDRRNFSNAELAQLITLLKMDGLINESQKNLLRQLTLLSK